jgi:hypothetical protein
MSDPFDGLIVVPAGPGAYDRARIVAERIYGPDVHLDQVGWPEGEIAYEVGEDE